MNLYLWQQNGVLVKSKRNFLKNSKTKEESFESQVSLVQFHPSYGYEEFIQGLKPLINDKAEGKSKSMSFEPVNGKLLNLIEDSEKIPRQINIKFPIQLKKEEKDYISYQFVLYFLCIANIFLLQTLLFQFW